MLLDYTIEIWDWDWSCRRCSSGCFVRFTSPLAQSDQVCSLLTELGAAIANSFTPLWIVRASSGDTPRKNQRAGRCYSKLHFILWECALEIEASSIWENQSNVLSKLGKTADSYHPLWFLRADLESAEQCLRQKANRLFGKMHHQLHEGISKLSKFLFSYIVSFNCVGAELSVLWKNAIASSTVHFNCSMMIRCSL